VKLKLLLALFIFSFSQTASIASESKSDHDKFLLAADHDRFAQALLMINKIIAKNPKDDFYLSERGRVLLSMNRLKESQADCDKALAINPKNVVALRTRAYCLLMGGAYAKGISDLNQVLKLYQPEPIFMFSLSDHENLARAYALTRQNPLANKERALAMLDQVTEQALLARETAGFQKALKLIDQVLAKDPKHLNALGVKGLCHNNLTQFKESIVYFNKVLAVKPNCTPLLYLRADSFRESKQYEKAIADLTKIIDLKPTHGLVIFKYTANTGRLRDKFTHSDVDCVNLADMHYIRATCYDGLKKYDLSVKDFNKTLELDPKEYKAAVGAGNAFFNAKKFKESIGAYDKALTLNPKFWEAYTLRSRAHEQMGDMDKAAADISTILTSHPKDVGAYALRAHIYKRAKKPEKAIADFTKMTELAPSDDEAFRERAETYAAMGQYERALKDYDKALSLSSEDKDVIAKAKAEVLKRIGRNPEKRK